MQMTDQNMPSYADLEAALNKTSLKLHPSQVQGIISGMICGASPEGKAWQELVTGSKKSAKAHELLQSLYDATIKTLKEFLFEFQLLLPDDALPLPQRAEALTLWCQGFLTGLKFVNVPITNRESSEVTEAINDIIEIAKMNYDEVVSSEEDEAAYVELVEYVRVAVILIYQDLTEFRQKTKAQQDQLH